MGRIKKTTTGTFYGWFVVLGLSIAGGFTMSMGIGNFGVFVEPMATDLEAGKTLFGLGMTARLIGFAASGPIVGRALDRFGTRNPLSIAVILFGLSVASLGLVQQEWQLLMLLCGMGLLGFWGSSSLYFSVLASQWFIRNRGKAMSVMFVGFPLGIAISVPITQILIDSVGWRLSWVVLGVVGSGVILLIARFVLRDSPEAIGLLPDGDISLSTLSSEPLERTSEYSWSVREAVRTGAFWRLSASFGTIVLGMSALGLFWNPYFIERGFTPSMAAWGLSAYALFQASMSVVLAPVVDRFQPRYIILFGFASFVSAFLIMMQATETWHMFVTAILAGSAVGIGMLLQAQMWPNYFGRRNIGSIRGAAFPLTLAFSGIGGAITGAIFDATGSYNLAWQLEIGLLIAGAMLIAVTPKPKPNMPT